jgi:hypothetical protein
MGISNCYGIIHKCISAYIQYILLYESDLYEKLQKSQEKYQLSYVDASCILCALFY